MCTVCLKMYQIGIVRHFISVIEMQMMQGDGATKDNAAFEEAGKCTTEATMNVQTVASLGRETTFIQKYKTQESFLVSIT